MLGSLFTETKIFIKDQLKADEVMFDQRKCPINDEGVGSNPALCEEK